jgi:putative membrane-bound dehydrogenase-like protein
MLAADTFPGLQVPDGFEVREFATDEQAHDVYSLTFDPLGRVVVSGPGYVRILEDRDGDGHADRVIPFANGPASGAQGMCFHGRSLLAIGDGGLLRYRDQNGDGQADGPPELYLRFKTGGEHDAHAVQQGPDGWWYVIAGNFAGITSAYATLPTSPVKTPRAGVLMRFKPDLTGGELIADGFRNAYDFAFNAHGDIFTYDSDDERDISLPWYRPTRVFHSIIGSDHGWVSKSWKRPDHFCDMPPVVAATGRGSPTGMVCYRHTQFPDEYRHGLFILDWTYGRVLALPLQRHNETWTAEAREFMTGLGGYGFAPTDVDVGPDGYLYVSVGGRGTRGAVYQVRWAKSPASTSPVPTSPDEQLEACLRAPQPLSSWSRNAWMPLARALNRGPFVAAILDEQRSPLERVRAVEIVTEMFGGLDTATVQKIARSSAMEVRARTAWSIGRTVSGGSASVRAADLQPFLADADPFVQRCAAEACLALPPETDFVPLMPAIARQLGSPHRHVRQAASAVVAKASGPALIAVSKGATQEGPQAVVAYAHGWLARVANNLPKGQQVVIPIALRVLKENYPTELKRDAVRLLQRSLGDLGPAAQRPAAFEAYASPASLDAWERDLDPLRSELAGCYPAQDALLNEELGRLIAMLQPYNPKVLDAVLAGITDDSPAVDDIHRLLISARIPVQRNAPQRRKIAHALVDLERKFAAQNLPQDSNWNDRIKEMYARLAELDPYLAATIVADEGFGRPGHVLFMSQLPGQYLPTAIEAFVRTIRATPDYPWNNDVIFVLASSSDPSHLRLVRDQYETFSVRGAVLMALAEKALPEDRPKFLAGLDSSQHEVLAACLGALAKLPADSGPDEQLALLKALRRLGQDEREYVAREQVVRLLERNTGHVVPFVNGKAGYQPQPNAVSQWTAWITQRWPEQAATQLGGSGAELVQLRNILAEAPWEQGDVSRGQKLFTARSCAQCHGGRNALGPDLAGSAGRFSRDDLFTAIVFPSRDVSNRYQTTIIETHQGKVYSGLIVYESVDGLLLRTGTNQTFRIASREIASRTQSPVSLMPNGLLKDLTPQDYADLYAYLRTLGAPPAVAEQQK